MACLPGGERPRVSLAEVHAVNQNAAIAGSDRHIQAIVHYEPRASVDSFREFLYLAQLIIETRLLRTQLYDPRATPNRSAHGLGDSASAAEVPVRDHIQPKLHGHAPFGPRGLARSARTRAAATASSGDRLARASRNRTANDPGPAAPCAPRSAAIP